MDIESILNALGIDLTNPEAKRGAIEAIDAILNSRQPSISLDSAASGMNGEQDVEIDPDLLQPSIKNKPQETSDDVEINDEEDILKNVKHNDSEDPQEAPASNKSEAGESEDNSDNSDDNDDNTSDSGVDNTAMDNQTDSESVDDSSDEYTEPDNSSTIDNSDESEADTANDEAEETEDEADENADDSDMDAADVDEVEDDFDGEADSDGDAAAEVEETEDEVDENGEETEDESEVDEDELVDDTLKDPFEDQADKAKHEARKIKRERTLQAAKSALANALAKNKAPALIRELEKAIEALESLQEAAGKSLKDMSDEEFNLIVNRVFDAIDALGDSGLTYSSEEERQLKAKEIKADLENKQTQAELSAEDVAKIRAETQAVKAREKEKAKYTTKSRGSFKGFQDFLSSLYRAIALQVHTEETRDDSWSAISRRNSGAGVLQQGKKINELPNKKIPVIDFYFDQSSSWDEHDIKVGEKAVAALSEMEEKGQIKINIYYFANHVHSDAASARYEGGTWAWNDIVKNIIATQATNVIIMTDSDMEDRWNAESYWDQGKAASYTVPGYVWYLWRNGSNAPRLPRDLKGRGGTQQFSFNNGDL